MKLGGYEVASEIGRGGMGAVYQGRDAAGRAVAIKVLLRALAQDERFVARFEREARAGAAVVHPNVTRVLGSGSDDGVPFIVLEHVPGGTLKSMLKNRGTPGPREAAHLGAQVARGLAAIHAAGLVHRDLKPENVLLDAEGRPKLTDFGLVGRGASADTHGRGALTKTGEVLGTFEYMSPEQIEDSSRVDARADLYSLGGVLYALLVGRPPFQGTGYALVKMHVADRPAPPRALDPAIPERLDALVLRLLEKDPAARPASATEVALELEAIALGGGDAPRRGRRALLAATALIALVAAGAGLLVLRDDPPASAPSPSPGTTSASPSPAATATPRPLVPQTPPPLPESRLGWFKETMPPGMRRGREQPFYRWDTGKELEVELVYVPPGTFVMGNGDIESPRSERPRHDHPMPRGFYFGRHETTNAEYGTFCRLAGHAKAPEPSFHKALSEPRERHPVVNVTWEDARAFCEWAGLRLPTEAEWEKAARGKRAGKFPWGDLFDGKKCNHGRGDLSDPNSHSDDSDGFRFTAPVGSFRDDVSDYGASDVAGNVGEWCEDAFSDSIYDRYAAGDFSPPVGPKRVARSATFVDAEWNFRLTRRSGMLPDQAHMAIGFRVARSAE